MDGAVIVTGASRGLGRGVALELARHGYSVVVNYRGNTAAAQATVADCQRQAQEAGHRQAQFTAVQANIALPEDRARLVDTAHEQFGSVRALVNNAGVAPQERADILEASERSFQELITTNLQGPYFLTQLVARHWLAQPSGEPFRAVVFVTSVSATTASVNRGEYCVSKAGLAMAAQLWSVRLAPHNIGVYELRPGVMQTDMTAAVQATYDTKIADGLVPQRRWGTPEDVGRAARSLIAGDFAFSTGSVIYSDGGLHLPRL